MKKKISELPFCASSGGAGSPCIKNGRVSWNKLIHAQKFKWEANPFIRLERLLGRCYYYAVWMSKKIYEYLKIIQMYVVFAISVHWRPMLQPSGPWKFFRDFPLGNFSTGQIPPQSHNSGSNRTNMMLDLYEFESKGVQRESQNYPNFHHVKI